MRKILTAATTLAVTLTLLPTPAQAAVLWSRVRYVSISRCDTGGPCGPWILSTVNGNHLRFPDARVHPLSRRGKPIKDRLSPIGVNGDGTRVAYVRDADGRVVVRDRGGALYTLLQGSPQDLRLSLDGARLAATLRGRVQIYDVASGSHLSTLPKGQEFAGFSGDGDEVLTSKGETLYSHTLGGRELARSKVGFHGPYALNADGVTVAWLTKDRGKGRAVLWDLTSDRPNVRTWVWLPDYKGMMQDVEMLDWTANGQLTVHVIDDVMRTPRGMHVLKLDLATSRFTVRDRFSVRSGAYGFEACGG